MKQLKRITWKQLWRLIVGSVKLGLFGKKKLLMAFEYGLTISEVAHEQKVELTPEMIQKAEKIILDSFSRNTTERVATEMLPTILAVFETDMSK